MRCTAFFPAVFPLFISGVLFLAFPLLCCTVVYDFLLIHRSVDSWVTLTPIVPGVGDVNSFVQVDSKFMDSMGSILVGLPKELSGTTTAILLEEQKRCLLPALSLSRLNHLSSSNPLSPHFPSWVRACFSNSVTSGTRFESGWYFKNSSSSPISDG